ncbi:B12-binding domain-containing radical SAM protein [Desulfosporosinus sp. PR]|uniref:B12-binding domain-containing radical SAM protein n=1 Tax=Candidatus Desulfosporosinus nitrosoreducens TaxID=3401928 RepID=UPI0027E63A2D|nr:B12-binding domain-containing radical SAM protein [Desulfosporosinus sp. PR]MDQ7093070.1 B12-binding domain-containing radical SAM protein [Desulfosporosinus sp. PR]
MRVLLVALNAKYVHTNLALRYLRESVRLVTPDVMLREFSINDRLDRIAGEIYEAKADVVGFSCYIWNIQEVLAVVRHLRPVCPEVRFVFGGPEVSFAVEEFLQAHCEVDALVLGEGEESFRDLLLAWREGGDPALVQGIAWKGDNKVHVNPPKETAPNLDELPFPYTGTEDFSGRIVYIETTRGCPFSCQYCLSSTFQGVRYLEPERFRLMFRRLLEQGARTIKFVDRTFNAHKRHAWRVLDVVREESSVLGLTSLVRVHCEMAGDLLDEEWMEYFRSYPQGLLQVEIGVQSTYQPTLEIVSRRQNFEHWKDFVPDMQALGIPVHLDLIAGLPEENWTDFRTSFNDVYSALPDMLQLGFLKVLKGSGLRRNSGRYGLLFTPDPPYTILETSALSHGKILQLQRMEDVLDKYYNSGKFKHALSEALRLFPTAFDFYHEFAEYWQKRHWFQRQWQGKALFDKLWEFIEWFGTQTARPTDFQDTRKTFLDALRFDYYLWERPNIFPDYFSLGSGPEANISSRRQEDIRRDGRWADVIPEFLTMDRRQWNRNTAVAYFETDVLRKGEEAGWFLFFYQQGKAKVYRQDWSAEQ